MRISESCAVCLYDRQKNRTDNAEYLAEIKKILDNRPYYLARYAFYIKNYFKSYLL